MPLTSVAVGEFARVIIYLAQYPWDVLRNVGVDAWKAWMCTHNSPWYDASHEPSFSIIGIGTQQGSSWVALRDQEETWSRTWMFVAVNAIIRRLFQRQDNRPRHWGEEKVAQTKHFANHGACLPLRKIIMSLSITSHLVYLPGMHRIPPTATPQLHNVSLW